MEHEGPLPGGPVLSVPIPQGTPVHSECQRRDELNRSFYDDDDEMWERENSEEVAILETGPCERYAKYDQVARFGPYKRTYKAFDNEEGIEVDWNEVRPDDTNMDGHSHERIIQALQALQHFEHPHIVKVLAFWLSTDGSYIIYITEVLSSGTLKKYVTDAKVLKLKIVKKWCRSILDALQYLHSQTPAICHGDIKCDNIFISGNSGQVKLVDPFHSIFLRGRSEIGTPAFMAPELYGDDYDEMVDIYAFGMCVLEMVTLETPYSECASKGQIFRKVSKSCLPNSLSMVRHAHGRRFIEKCLLPAESRATAEQLLRDPFLAPCEEDSMTVGHALRGSELPAISSYDGSRERDHEGDHRDAGRRGQLSNALSEPGSPDGSVPPSPTESPEGCPIFGIESITMGKAPRVLNLVGRLHLNGLVKQLSLDFRLDQDTCQDVADELVEAFKEGCPRLDAREVSQEIERAVLNCDYTAVQSPRMLGNHHLQTEKDLYRELDEMVIQQERQIQELVIQQERQIQDLARRHSAQSAALLAQLLTGDYVEMERA